MQTSGTSFSTLKDTLLHGRRSPGVGVGGQGIWGWVPCPFVGGVS